jgi:hypothetical protein
MHPISECRVRILPDQKSDPLHVFKGVNLTKSFSNAFSNADGYVRSRLNVSEVKRKYSMRLRTRANVSELERTAWHARGQEFESSYLH